MRSLFDPEQVAGPAKPTELTVSEVARLIGRTLQAVPGPLRVIGQVSNLSTPGHWYFTLKDDNAVVGCVAWSSDVRQFGFVPEEGTEVIATGSLDFYGPQGRTQLYVRKLEPVGAGALELRFRAMCAELRGLGYFDEAHKLPLPVFPRRIAVVTSGGGAAIHDCLDTATQRCPAVELVLVDVRVQGDGAAEEIAAAIRRTPELGVDAVLVTRGGGSVEDLWAFNERVVADAAFECPLPLVAAIGHESDTTVIELVADVRAATPTQAVMRLVPAETELRQQIDHLEHRLVAQLRRRLEVERQRVERAPKRLLAALRRRADQRVVIAQRHRRLAAAVRHAATRRRERLDALSRQLDSLDPHRVLQRGYSYTTTADGRIVQSVDDVAPGDRIVTRVTDGSIASDVTEG